MKRKDFLETAVLATGSLLYAPASNLTKTSPTMDFKLTIRDADVPNICKTCGTRFASNCMDEKHCPICLDDRQYLKEYGQQWISYHELKQQHTVRINKLRDDLYELTTHPSFAIGQRALFVTTPEGNILWDCIPLLDEASAAFIKQKGGLKAIVISHPHYYSLMAEWAEAFKCNVYLHKKDSNWVMDESSRYRFWNSNHIEFLPGIQVIHLGGHFPGSSVLHLTPKNKKSALLIGDTLYLSRNKKHLSAMYSYPNVIPLSQEELFEIFNKVNAISFDSLYGAFAWQTIHTDAKEILKNSMATYHKAFNN